MNDLQDNNHDAKTRQQTTVDVLISLQKPLIFARRIINNVGGRKLYRSENISSLLLLPPRWVGC